MVQRYNRPAYSAICRLMLVGYLVALFIATHLPPNSPFLPSEDENLDKLYHFAAYAIFALLLATVWQLAAGTLTFGHLRWTWIVVAVCGALDEITQIPVSRDCSFWDWLADAIGAAAGLLVFVWLRKTLAARTTRRE